MKININYLNYHIEIFYDLSESGYFIHHNGEMVDGQLGFKGFNFRSNGCLEHAKERVNMEIARNKLRSLKNAPDALLNI